MAESAKNHIDSIRKNKFSIGGADNPLTEDLHQAVKNLSAELYAKDVHFLMELIQNAEDNEYPKGVDPSLEFVITSEDITATGAPATLLIFNNEKGFSEKNIESICSVGRSTKKGNRKRGYIGEKDFLAKVSVKWLRTNTGYRIPGECLLLDNSWELELSDGPFIDEEFYGSELKSFRKELIAIRVGHDSTKACELLFSNIYTHSHSDAISRVYRFLCQAKWKPEKCASSGRIWIPSDEKWADVSSCVLYDKDMLFGSKLYVLENHYESDKDHEIAKLFGFFSSVFGVKTNPSVEDYCDLWKDWEGTKYRLSYDECCAFWSYVVQHSYTKKAGQILSESFSRLPVYSPDCNNDEGIMLSNVSDVFIADDLLVKDLFIDSPVFVWNPTPSIPALPRTKLVDLYRKIGVKEISKCVEVTEADLTEPEEVVDPKNNLIGPGLVKLILGFISDPTLKIEAEERSGIMQRLVDLDVKETTETISTEYTLNLPSSGVMLIAKAKRMIRWEREKGVIYAEKMEKVCGKGKVLEYATCFAEVIAKGVMWEREDLIGRLSELVKLAYLVEFDEEALEFLMKSNNLQVYDEDEKFISVT